MTKKVQISDLKPADFDRAREIIHAVIASQAVPANTLGYLALVQILSGYWKGIKKLVEGLYAGLDAGLCTGLDAGLYDGLYAGLRDGLDDGLLAGLGAGLRDGLCTGLYAGLRDGLDVGLNVGLNAGLDAGLDDGLDAGLRDGLDDGLDAGLDAGLLDGLRAGLNGGLYDGLHAGLNKSLCDKLRLVYCGIWWSWWLCRYLIAESWGCKLDKKKLFLLRAFCLLCPIIGKYENKPIILPKPKKIRWNITGKTKAPFEFPIYELHGNGVPSVEYWGFNLYHWHGIKIPERMGKVNCEHWRPEWILDEDNAEVRRVLVSELGYERVVHKLGCKVLDTWREYELLNVPMSNMPVKYNVLKMTCPSTGDIHMLRVPPTVETAEQAITWCNHGHHPDEFVTQQ